MRPPAVALRGWGSTTYNCRRAFYAAQSDERLKLWSSLEQGFSTLRPSRAAVAHQLVYRCAVRLMQSEGRAAFDLEQEPAKVCRRRVRPRPFRPRLPARPPCLVERGVPFIEVTHGAIESNSVGWDTHQNNFTAVKSLSNELDAGGMLLAELRERGRWNPTTIVWMGEFGRTPKINPQAGRDHFPNAWSAVLAGGGIRGGQAYGSTTADGMAVADNPVNPGDLIATLCGVLRHLTAQKQNTSEMGRPIRIAEGQAIGGCWPERDCKTSASHFSCRQAIGTDQPRFRSSNHSMCAAFSRSYARYASAATSILLLIALAGCTRSRHHPRRKKSRRRTLPRCRTRDRVKQSRRHRNQTLATLRPLREKRKRTNPLQPRRVTVGARGGSDS